MANQIIQSLYYLMLPLLNAFNYVWLLEIDRRC